MSRKKINYIKKVNIYKPEFPLWAMILFKTIFITFIICCAVVAVFSFVYVCTPVDGPSMLPTLNAQQYDEEGNLIEGSSNDSVYINRFGAADYGDIIVAKSPVDGKYVIKRLIAKEGDKVAVVAITNEIFPANRTYKVMLIKSGQSEVEILDEPYLEEGTSLYQTYYNFTNYRSLNPERFTQIDVGNYGQVYFLTLNDGEFFYLGDNREDSRDCAEYGPNTENNYVGRVDIIVHESENHFSQIFLYFWHLIFG